MKKRDQLHFIFFLLLSAALFQSCEQVEIAGTIVDESGTGQAAKLEIICIAKDSEKYELNSNEEGKFSKKIGQGDRYIVNVHKEGYAFVSKVYYAPSSKIVIRLTKATSATVDAGQRIEVVDTQLNKVDGIDSTALSFKSPWARIPFVYNQKGVLVDFKIPTELQASYQLMANGVTTTGTRVSIQPNSIVNNSGRPVSGNVQIYVSTINLLSPDGMPGDWSVRTGETIGYMVSYGAANIEIYQNGERLQLNGKQPATLSIPVDPTVLARNEPLPDSIPYLTYLSDVGEWKQEGYGRLNSEKTAYTTQVMHFSTANFDFLKSDWACVRVKAGFAPTIDANVMIPGMSPRERSLDNPGDCASMSGMDNLHGLLRLPVNSVVGVSFSDPSNPSTIYANFVQYTGPAIPGTTTATRPCPYSECNPTDRIIELSESTVTYLIAKESATISATSVPPSGIASSYTSTADAGEIAWVYGGFDFTDPWNAANPNRVYVLSRSDDDGLGGGFGAYTPIALVTNGFVQNPQDMTQTFVANKDGFDKSKFKVEVTINGSLVSTAASLEITIDWP